MAMHPDDLLHQFYDMLMESQYWQPEQMRLYQEEQLEHLLRHARANSPFYANRLAPVFRNDNSVDFEKWREIPILTRNDLAQHRDAMLATNVPPHHGQALDYSTSGSTGLPVTVRSNGIASLAGRAAEYRAFEWHGIDYSQNLCRIIADESAARWPDGRRSGPWGPPWAYGTSAGRMAEISMFDSYEKILEFIERTESEYLIANSTMAYALALEAQRLHLNLGVGKLFNTSATPTAPERDIVRRVFGADLLDRYASKEANAIGHSCPSGTHFHIHAENILVEVLRPDGRPCEPGETGRVIVTPFLSTHQPIIRYEQGDLATVGTPCGCGRTLPVLQELAGRTRHMFRFPDGTITFRRLPETLRSQLKARGWQVAQVEPLRIELRYEPSDPDEIGDEAAALAFMSTLYPPNVKLSVRRVDKVPLTKAGKLIEYVSELEP